MPVSGNYYGFTLSALTSANVVITDIEATVVSQAPPMQGVYPPPWTGGCGGVVPSTFRLNLDDSPVSVVATPGEGMGGPISLPHQIDQDRPEVWHLTPVTQNCLCEWVATVHWTVGDQAFSSTIDDDGKPFQVTATSAATMIDNDDGQLNHWQVTTLGG